LFYHRWVCGGVKNHDIGHALLAWTDLQTDLDHRMNPPLPLTLKQVSCDQSLQPSVRVYAKVALQNAAVHCERLKSKARTAASPAITRHP
jgi:hypothetical protein